MSKYLSLTILLTSLGLQIFPQSKSGITHKPDTSFTTYQAYLSTKKTHPDIKIVEELPMGSVVELRNIRYKRVGMELEDSLVLDAFLPNLPKKEKSIAVIIIHGGGWRTGDRSQHYPLAQRLAKLGYVCFTPQYRLSTEALYPAAVIDIKTAIQWVRFNAKNFYIDTNRIVVLGFSAGGELAAFMGATNGMTEFEDKYSTTNTSSRVQAVVDIDGILSFIHPESGEGDDSKRISAATNWFGYPKKDNPELWKQASALTHVGKHSPPYLFLNSSVARMHAGREDFIKVLDQHGIYSEVHEFEGAPHSFCLFDPWFEPTVKYIDGFLKKVFKN